MINTVNISIEEYDNLRKASNDLIELKKTYENEIIKGERFQEKIDIFQKVYNKDKANTYLASDLFNILETIGMYNSYRTDKTIKIIDDNNFITVIPYEKLGIEDKEGNK